VKRHCPRARPGEKGAAAVEFAIILPLLLLIIAGIVDFGRAFFTQVVLTNAAREGARAAVVRVSEADVQARTLAAANPLTPTVIPGTCPATGGTFVTVTVTEEFNWIILEPISNFFGGVGSLPAVLSSDATMRCGG
jgi:Flp pilus assembly protein TadG